MKRQSLLFVAGAMLAFASCNNDANTTTGNDMSQAQIDSAVDARVEEMRMQMMASNDSLINELAIYKADSMCAVKGGKATPPRKPSAKPTNGGSVTPVGKPSGTVNDRPGASNNGGTVNDRPGASNSTQGNGTVNDRPGSR